MSYVFANDRYHDLHGTEGRFHAVLGELVEIGSFEGYTLIVPTGRRKRMLDRMLTRDLFNRHFRPVPDLPIHTLERFAQSIFERIILPGTHRIISDAYRLMLFEEAMETVDLPFYRGLSDHLSRQTIEKCAELLYGLRKDGITAEALSQELQSPDPKSMHGIHDAKRIHDLSVILAEYETILARENLLDYPALLSLITETIHKTPDSILDYGIIIMDGFSEFTEPEWLFLDALERSSTPFACFLEYDPANGPLFGNFDETFSKLGNTGFKPHKMTSHDGEYSELHDHLRHHLFSGRRPIAQDSFKNPFTILECMHPQAEVDAIARYVKWLHGINQVPLSDIVIAMRNPEQYSGLFREIFPLHGLPVNITDRPKLPTSPVITAVFLLFDIIRHSCRIEDLRNIIMSPYIMLPRLKESPKLLEAFDHVIKAMRIKGGKGIREWERALVSYRRLLRDREREIIMQMRPDRDALKNLNKRQNEISMIEEVLSILQDILPSQESMITPDQAIQNLKELIKKCGIMEMLESLSMNQKKNANIDIHQTSSELLERDVRALRMLFQLMDEYAVLRMHRNPNVLSSMKVHVERITSIVHGSQFQIREKPGTGITVTSMEQIRELEYSNIILCGMYEGSSPLTYTVDTFMGRELPDSEERHIRRERMSFYLSLVHHAPSDKPRSFLLSYPAMGMDMTELMRSHFLDELMLITGMNPEQDICKQTDQQDDRITFLRYLTKREESVDIALANTDESYAKLDEIILQWNSKNQIQRKHEPITEHAVFNRDVFSITELNEYAECPYLYFSKRLLRLKEEDTVTSWISSLENGIFFHDVLHKFYTSPLFPKQSIHALHPVQFDLDKKEEYKAELHRIARNEFALIDYDHPFIEVEKQTIFGNEEKGIKGRLDIWFEMEWNLMKSSTHKPTLFEIGFGNKNDAIPAIDLGNGLKLKGKIDRIELSPDMQSFIIADYKTGKKVPTNADINKGKEQQMPLYALAAEQFLSKEFRLNECNFSHAIYYSLHDGTSKVVLDPEQKRSPSKPLGELLKLSQEYVASIHDADFHVKDKKEAFCEHCTFDSLCRIKAMPPMRGEIGPEEEA
jgi:ATP-dependent helicase/nuclease subunit B